MERLGEMLRPQPVQRRHHGVVVEEDAQQGLLGLKVHRQGHQSVTASSSASW